MGWDGWQRGCVGMDVSSSGLLLSWAGPSCLCFTVITVLKCRFLFLSGIKKMYSGKMLGIHGAAGREEQKLEINGCIL